jgi:hypothetical protein
VRYVAPCLTRPAQPNQSLVRYVARAQPFVARSLQPNQSLVRYVARAQPLPQGKQARLAYRVTTTKVGVRGGREGGGRHNRLARVTTKVWCVM